ncbi:hypothetical protein GCM10007867_31860 [Gluconobacter cerinus]|uniref:Phosphoadenosine phosphosulfate reductase n=1 Tax=Gluconobacter cerinus TaxID=38307 RepID=A0AAV5NJH6_9PROT|nr:hypothetical protein GCM10007867_31860 [Gluconobacter cerinus]
MPVGPHGCSRQPVGNMTPDLASYDSIIVAVSGGKDGTACLLALHLA